MSLTFSDATHCSNIQYKQIHEKLQNSAITVHPENPQGLFIVTIQNSIKLCNPPPPFSGGGHVPSGGVGYNPSPKLPLQEILNQELQTCSDDNTGIKYIVFA